MELAQAEGGGEMLSGNSHMMRHEDKVLTTDTSAPRRWGHQTIHSEMRIQGRGFARIVRRCPRQFPLLLTGSTYPTLVFPPHSCLLLLHSFLLSLLVAIPFAIQLFSVESIPRCGGVSCCR